MNIPAYIDSGILESYALGLTSESEAHELEQLMKEFPAIRIELNNIEDTLLRFSTLLQKEPPQHLRSLIIKNATSIEPPARTETKILPLNKSAGKTNWFAVISSVLFILLAACGAYIYFLRQQMDIIRHSQASTNTENAELLAAMAKKTEVNIELQLGMEMMMKPGNKIIELKGIEAGTNAMAIVCWNHQSKEVLLNVVTLPGVPEGKQYQLWASAAGQMVDLGVLDISPDQQVIKRMKSIDSPEEFIITLENAGGSLTPAMNTILVSGKNL